MYFVYFILICPVFAFSITYDSHDKMLIASIKICQLLVCIQVKLLLGADEPNIYIFMTKGLYKLAASECVCVQDCVGFTMHKDIHV